MYCIVLRINGEIIPKQRSENRKGGMKTTENPYYNGYFITD